MALQRWCYRNFQAIETAGDFARQRRQIALHVQAKAKKIGDDDHAVYAGGDEPGHGSREVGIPQFQKGGLDMRQTARTA